MQPMKYTNGIDYFIYDSCSFPPWCCCWMPNQRWHFEDFSQWMVAMGFLFLYYIRVLQKISLQNTVVSVCFIHSQHYDSSFIIFMCVQHHLITALNDCETYWAYLFILCAEPIKYDSGQYVGAPFMDQLPPNTSINLTACCNGKRFSNVHFCHIKLLRWHDSSCNRRRRKNRHTQQQQQQFEEIISINIDILRAYG